MLSALAWLERTDPGAHRRIKGLRRARPGHWLVLVTGAFLVGYLKRFGILGAGVGSQVFLSIREPRPGE